MATTPQNAKAANKVKPALAKIVNTLPNLRDAEFGEIYLLISDSHADDKKLHVRSGTGWLKSAALS